MERAYQDPLLCSAAASTHEPTSQESAATHLNLTLALDPFPLSPPAPTGCILAEAHCSIGALPPIQTGPLFIPHYTPTERRGYRGNDQDQSTNRHPEISIPGTN
jgi:hypothetical protein